LGKSEVFELLSFVKNNFYAQKQKFLYVFFAKLHRFNLFFAKQHCFLSEIIKKAKYNEIFRFLNISKILTAK